MPPNHTHKIVHSSAMYYQNLIVIHESSKKLTIKSVKKKLTPIGVDEKVYIGIVLGTCSKLAGPFFMKP